jgi:penicillin-binding protein 2
MALNNDEVSPPQKLSLLRKITITLFIILAGRLWYLQIIQELRYMTLSQKNSIKLVRLQAPRGEIMDRNGEVLVGNRPCFNILAFRSKEKENAGWDELCSALGEKKKLSDFPPEKFSTIKKDATREEISRIEEKKPDLPEVSIEIQPKRHYPHGHTASHILGYVGEITDVELQHLRQEGYLPGDIVGKSGVEKNFEAHLRGKDGGKQIIVDACGSQVDVLGCKEPLAGNELRLTIDYRIQEFV